MSQSTKDEIDNRIKVARIVVPITTIGSFIQIGFGNHANTYPNPQ